MKTPKEKAKELVERFGRNHIILTHNSKGKPTSPYKSGYIGNKTIIKQAKQCALICVDEIMESHFAYNTYSNIERINENKEYWQEVKQEIEKL